MATRFRAVLIILALIILANCFKNGETAFIKVWYLTDIYLENWVDGSNFHYEMPHCILIYYPVDQATETKSPEICTVSWFAFDPAIFLNSQKSMGKLRPCPIM